jgi:hypothetical protein
MNLMTTKRAGKQMSPKMMSATSGFKAMERKVKSQA